MSQRKETVMKNSKTVMSGGSILHGIKSRSVFISGRDYECLSMGYEKDGFAFLIDGFELLKSRVLHYPPCKNGAVR